jgi:hypothetical protein
VYWKVNKDSNRLFGIVGGLLLEVQKGSSKLMSKIRRINEEPCHEKAIWNFSKF